MPRARATSQRAPRVLMPLIVAIGPLICAVTLTTLAFFMFQAQEGASNASQGSHTSAPLEYTVILALTGALIAFLMGALGLTLHNRMRRTQEVRDEALTEGLARMERVDDLVKRIGERGEWREAAAMAWTRRQRRALEAIGAMGEPRASLQRAASDIWAGMSQPGMGLDARTAMGLTRQSAVSGAALGAALDELQAQLAAAPGDLEEMKAAGDTLFQELNALQEATRHMRLMFSLAAGAESEALTGSMRAQRAPASAQSPYATHELGATSPDPGATGGMGAVGPDALYGASDNPRIMPQAPPVWPGSQTGMRPSVRDPRDPRQGWQNGAANGLPSLDPNASNGSQQRPPYNQPGQSGQWPRQPGPNDGRSGPNDPRRRDDTNSRWLND